MEHSISAFASALVLCKEVEYSHKAIGKTHGTENNHVHQERYHYHDLIEAHKSFVFLQSVGNQICLDSANEVPVETGVDKQIKYLLNAVVNLVDVYPTSMCKRS
jgi:hypothetical protein